MRSVVCALCLSALLWSVQALAAIKLPEKTTQELDVWRLTGGLTFAGTQLSSGGGSTLPLPNGSTVGLSMSYLRHEFALAGTLGTSMHGDVMVMKRIYSEEGIFGGDLGVTASLTHDRGIGSNTLYPGIGLVVGNVVPRPGDAGHEIAGWRFTYTHTFNGGNLFGITLDLARFAHKSRTVDIDEE